MAKSFDRAFRLLNADERLLLRDLYESEKKYLTYLVELRSAVDSQEKQKEIRNKWKSDQDLIQRESRQEAFMTKLTAWMERTKSTLSPEHKLHLSYSESVGTSFVFYLTDSTGTKSLGRMTIQIWDKGLKYRPASMDREPYNRLATSHPHCKDFGALPTLTLPLSERIDWKKLEIPSVLESLLSESGTNAGSSSAQVQ